MKLRTLVVDDHPLMLGGLRQALQAEPNIELVGDATNGANAVKLALELSPDLIVMDLHLPDITGIEATQQIVESRPDCKVVIFSGDANRSLVDAALRAGASAYLVKYSVAGELLQAIKLVMQGRLYLSPEVSSFIVEDYRKSLTGNEPAQKLALTNRERQLLKLVADGRRNKEIAEDMNISANSVETYRARLMKKLGCSSTAELVRYAIREGVADA